MSERKKRTYLGLIKITLELLQQKGLDGVSVRELADLANVAPMTIHNVFGSKEALFSAAIEDNTRQFISHAFEEEKHGFEGLLAANARIVESAIKSNMLMRSVAGMLARDTSLFAVRQIYLIFHCRFIREMKEKGLLIPDVHPEAVAMMMMISHNAAINSWVNDEIDDQAVAALFDLQTCNALYPVLSERARPLIDACYRDRMKMIASVDSESYFTRGRRSPTRFDITLLTED